MDGWMVGITRRRTLMSKQLNIEKGAYVPEGNPSETPPTDKEPTRTMTISAHCDDSFSMFFSHMDLEYDGYVPGGMGIQGDYGDMVEMTIDIDTGRILGVDWKNMTDKKIKKCIDDMSS